MRKEESKATPGGWPRNLVSGDSTFCDGEIFWGDSCLFEEKGYQDVV